MAEVPLSSAAIEALKKDIDRGSALLKARQTEAALAHFRGILSRAADHSVVRSTLLTFMGQCHKQAGRTKDALEAYAEAIRLQPSNVEAHFHRADVLDDLGQLDEALSCYEAVLALDPRHTRALTDRGYVLAKLGREDEAIASYDAAINLDPRNAIAWNNRGNVFLVRGDRDEARRSYHAALQIDPNQANARARLEDLARPPAPVIDYQRIAVERAAREDPFLAGFGAVLDFSPASIVAIDAFLDEMYGAKGAAPGAAGYSPDAAKKNLILELGCYFGETLRRAFGGSWRDDPASPGQVLRTQVALTGAPAVFPIARVFKRLRDGAAEPLFPAFVAVRSRLAPKGLPGEADGYFRQAERFAGLGGEHGASPYAARLYQMAAQLDPSKSARSRGARPAEGVAPTASPVTRGPAPAPASESRPEVRIPLHGLYPGAPLGLPLLDPPFAPAQRNPTNAEALAGVLRTAGLDNAR